MDGMSNVNSKIQNNVKNPLIQLGFWQAVFLFLLCVNLLLPYICRILGLPVYSIDLFLVLPVALIFTFLIWIIFNLVIYFWPSTGLDIGRILGKYEMQEDSAWQFKKYPFANRKASLELKKSSPHILIVGGSQTGKSTTIKTILTKISNAKDTGNIILDYHGEYNFLANKGFHVIDVRNYDPLAPNYKGEEFENIVSDFVEAFVIAFETTGDVQLAILKKKLEKNQTVSAALTAIEIDAVESHSFTEKDRLSGLSLRLEKIARYAGGKNTLVQLTKKNKNIVFDFSGIRDRDAADFFAENILRRYLALLVEAKQPTNILIDEAHRLNAKFLAERGIETTTVRMARESGKFSGRLIVASQNLTDFTPGFSANFGNIICFRIPTGSDLQILEHLTGIRFGMLQSVVNGLHKGEALLIGPHNHYSLIKISAPQLFPNANSALSQGVFADDPVPLATDSAAPAKELFEAAPILQQSTLAASSDLTSVPMLTTTSQSSGQSTPIHVLRSEEILDLLKKHGALTGAGISKRSGYPRPACFRRTCCINRLKSDPIRKNQQFRSLFSKF